MIVSVDLGGTKTRTMLVDSGKVVKQITFLTEPSKGRSYIIKELFKSINYVIEGQSIEAILIAVAGTTDGKVVKEAPNLKIKNLRLASIVESKYKKECFLENDANAFTYGEFVNLRSKNKTLSNMVGVTLGTGIGAGIIINGTLYRGFNFSAGEVGHMTISSEHRKCSCGNYDCWELYASSKFIRRQYLKEGHRKLDAKEVAQLVKSDKAAKKVILEFSKNVGVGLVNLANILAPQIIVLGGGLANIDMLYSQSVNYFKKHVLPPLREVKIVKSHLGKEAVALGLFHLYKNNLLKDKKKSSS